MDRGLPVVFLDFDGVISTLRAHTVNRHMDDHRARWIDPVSTGLIAEVAERHAFRIVISSTWRMFGRPVIERVLAPSGLDKLIDRDWQTNNSPDGSRPWEIDDWLARNGEPDFIILDDDSFAWTGRQYARWVKCDPVNGLTFEAWRKFSSMFAIQGDGK